MIEWVKRRAREPSTWAGLAGMIPAAVTLVSQPTPEAIGAMVAGIAAVLMRESGNA